MGCIEKFLNPILSSFPCLKIGSSMMRIPGTRYRYSEIIGVQIQKMTDKYNDDRGKDWLVVGQKTV
jgi:hypothetical protein